MHDILHLSAAAVYGGGEEHLRVLLTELVRRGLPVALAGPAGAPLAGKLAGTGVQCLAWGPFSAADPRAPLSLAALVRREQPALVHSHNALEDLAAASLRLTGFSGAVFTTVHDRINMDSEGRRRTDPNARIYLRVLRAGFDRILAVSEATRRDLIDYAGVPAHRVRAIVNGTSFERLDAAPAREAARAKLGIPPAAVAFAQFASRPWPTAKRWTCISRPPAACWTGSGAQACHGVVAGGEWKPPPDPARGGGPFPHGAVFGRLPLVSGRLGFAVTPPASRDCPGAPEAMAAVAGRRHGGRGGEAVAPGTGLLVSLGTPARSPKRWNAAGDAALPAHGSAARARVRGIFQDGWPTTSRPPTGR